MARLEVGPLRFHAVEPLAQLVVLLGRERVAGTELVEAPAQGPDPARAGRIGRFCFRCLGRLPASTTFASAGS